jgi:hypothetical protein
MFPPLNGDQFAAWGEGQKRRSMHGEFFHGAMPHATLEKVQPIAGAKAGSMYALGTTKSYFGWL